MKKSNYTTLVILGGLLLATAACATAVDDRGKMPISTSSVTAKEAYLKGRDLAERLKAADARKEFEKAVTEDPNFALAHLNVALNATSAKMFFGSLAKAVALVDRVSAAERLWIKGQEAGANGDPASQKKLWQELAGKYPGDERAQNLLGGFYFGQQQWQEAIQQYQKAIAINSDFSPPYNQLGYAYRFLGKYDEAERIFQKYIQLIPDDPNPYDSYAELLLKEGKYDESIANYRKALDHDPTFVASALGIATNLNHQGDYAAARRELDNMIASAGNDGQRRTGYFARAISFVFQGDAQSALTEINKMYKLAESIDDASAMAGDLGNMANILLQFGKADQAEKEFEQARAIIRASSLSENQKQLAERFYHANLTQVAIANWDLATAKEEAGEFGRQAQAAHNSLQIRMSHQLAGRIALSEKQYDTALSELKQASQQNPLNLYRIALAYEGKGQQAEAGQWREQAENFNAVNSLNQAFVHLHSSKMMSAKH